jgi:hypothetical protein
MTSDTTYDDVVKEVAWRAWFRAWEERIGAESTRGVTKRTARSRFERYWRRNYE